MFGRALATFAEFERRDSRMSEFREPSGANLCCRGQARQPVIAENRRYHGEGIAAQSAQLTKIREAFRSTSHAFRLCLRWLLATLFPPSDPYRASRRAAAHRPTRIRGDSNPSPFDRVTRTRGVNKWAVGWYMSAETSTEELRFLRISNYPWKLTMYLGRERELGTVYGAGRQYRRDVQSGNFSSSLLEVTKVHSSFDVRKMVVLYETIGFIPRYHPLRWLYN